MTTEEPDLREQFEQELEKIRRATIGGKDQQKRRLVVWGIRTGIATLLYITFWDQSWVRWTLVAYIPLNLFSLLSARGWNYFLNRKMEKTLKKIEQAEKALAELESQDQN